MKKLFAIFLVLCSQLSFGELIRLDIQGEMQNGDFVDGYIVYDDEKTPSAPPTLDFGYYNDLYDYSFTVGNVTLDKEAVQYIDSSRIYIDNTGHSRYVTFKLKFYNNTADGTIARFSFNAYFDPLVTPLNTGDLRSIDWEQRTRHPYITRVDIGAFCNNAPARYGSFISTIASSF